MLQPQSQDGGGGAALRLKRFNVINVSVWDVHKANTFTGAHSCH